MNFHSMFITKNKCLLFFSTLILSGGLVLMVFKTWLFNFFVSSMLVLKPSSMVFDVWQVPPIPLYLDFYFFNWTNPEEIYDLSTKPKFKQMGPYRFKQEKEKVNLTWNSNDTVTYKQMQRFYFDLENSVGNLSDQLTTINAVTLSAVNQVKDWSYLMRTTFSMSLGVISPQIHITKPIGQILFDGYQDTYIDLALNLPFLADTLPPFDKFGWFYGRNNSYNFDGVFNMATGTAQNNLGELLSWNYKNVTQFYPTPCSKVYGAAGELNPQYRDKNFVTFFSTDMCRNVRMDYEKNVLVNDIDGYRYSAQHGMLDNGTVLPENKCYCNGECLPSGMLNVSACRYGTPSFVSLPHFYGADPVYLDMVEGLEPEKSKHDTYITLEPRTGAILEGVARLQLNMKLFPVNDVSLYTNVPTLFFPILWFEQKGSIPSDMAFMMRVLLNLPTILSILGSVMMITSLLIFSFSTRKPIIKLFSSSKAKVFDGLEYDAVPLDTITKVVFVPVKPESHLKLDNINR